LTDLRSPGQETASLQIVGLERSRALVEHAVANRMSMGDLQHYFGSESRPMRVGPGQVVFFTQENIHGNFVNETGKTRVSIDFRTAEAKYGDQLARKPVGGYFELMPPAAGLGPASQAAAPANATAAGRSAILYLNNSTNRTVGVPVHLQRYMLKDYCDRKRIGFDFELFELDGMTHLPTLQHIVSTLRCDAVLYSIYSLPESRPFRVQILDDALNSSVALHFANEDIVVTSSSEREHLEDVLSFAKFGKGPIATS